VPASSAAIGHGSNVPSTPWDLTTWTAWPPEPIDARRQGETREAVAGRGLK
jgi:hypothetical protein